MPASLCTAFTELREYVQLQNQYHDGTIQRSQLAQTSRRTFRLSKRLSASVLSALYSFWVSQNAGLTPFAFYNPFDVASGQQIGSNYDPTGNNTQGRVTVVFRGNWAQATDIARTNVQGPMSDTIGRITVPTVINSGQTFPLTTQYPFGFSVERPVIVHRFGSLDAKQEQRYYVGIGPRKFQFKRPNLNWDGSEPAQGVLGVDAGAVEGVHLHRPQPRWNDQACS
jgi:hypothetical protein